MLSAVIMLILAVIGVIGAEYMGVVCKGSKTRKGKFCYAVADYFSVIALFAAAVVIMFPLRKSL